MFDETYKICFFFNALIFYFTAYKKRTALYSAINQYLCVIFIYRIISRVWYGKKKGIYIN